MPGLCWVLGEAPFNSAPVLFTCFHLKGKTAVPPTPPAMFWFLPAPAFAYPNSPQFCVVLPPSRRCPVRVQSPAIYKTWQNGGGGGGGMQHQAAVCLLHKLRRQVAYCFETLHRWRPGKRGGRGGQKKCRS